jgi:hypothetical protein
MYQDTQREFLLFSLKIYKILTVVSPFFKSLT